MSFEWIPLPKVSSLTVSPLVSTLSAGEACRVELTFVPSPEEDSKFTEDIPAAVGSIVYSQSVRASEPWSKHGRWTIPCFIRPSKASGSDSKEMEQGSLPPLIRPCSVCLSELTILCSHTVGQSCVGGAHYNYEDSAAS